MVALWRSHSALGIFGALDIFLLDASPAFSGNTDAAMVLKSGDYMRLVFWTISFQNTHQNSRAVMLHCFLIWVAQEQGLEIGEIEARQC